MMSRNYVTVRRGVEGGLVAKVLSGRGCGLGLTASMDEVRDDAGFF